MFRRTGSGESASIVGVLIILGVAVALLGGCESTPEGAAPPATASALFRAAASGDAAVANQILQADPNLVSARDKLVNQTPLHLAAKGGFKDVIDVLLAKGADVNAKCMLGVTPLQMAAGNGHAAAVEALLAKGADINLVDDAAQTALRYAVDQNQKAVVELLLAKGADAKIKDKAGKTPLDVATAKGLKEIVAVFDKQPAK